MYKGHLNESFHQSPGSSVCRSSDLTSQVCEFESHCGQGFVLYFVAFEELLAGRLVPYK